MTIAQRMNKLERQTKRQRLALVVLAVALCGVVSMAATGSKITEFDTVVAKTILLKNDAGQTSVAIGAGDGGSGVIMTYSPSGRELVKLTSTSYDHGMVMTYGPTGKHLVDLGVAPGGNGMVTTYGPTGEYLVNLGVVPGGNGIVTTYGPTGKMLVNLGATDNGGAVVVFNKTEEQVVTLKADEYGNGEVGAWNRKNTGRTLRPGP